MAQQSAADESAAEAEGTDTTTTEEAPQSDTTETASESVEVPEETSKVLEAGKGPDERAVGGDAIVAATEVDAEEQAKAEEEAAAITAASTPYNQPGPKTLDNVPELTAEEKEVQRFNQQLLVNPGSLYGQVGQVDTTGTAGRSDAASNAAVGVVFHHPARLAQQADAKAKAEESSAAARLAQAVKDLQAENA